MTTRLFPEVRAPRVSRWKDKSTWWQLVYISLVFTISYRLWSLGLFLISSPKQIHATFIISSFIISEGAFIVSTVWPLASQVPFTPAQDHFSKFILIPSFSDEMFVNLINLRVHWRLFLSFFGGGQKRKWNRYSHSSREHTWIKGAPAK